MKLWMKLALVGLASFGAGFGAGYFVRKRTCEVEFEEISEEELDNLVSKAENKPVEAAEEPSEDNNKDNTEVRKEAYFKLWKETNEQTSKYDTRTKDAPNEVEVTPEEVEKIGDFLKKDLKAIEPASMNDWHHWLSLAPDGEYDPIELYWYPSDNLVCDENNEPLEDSDKFIGFDVKEMFETVDPETTGDPQIRVIFNHKTHSIFFITERTSSYNTIKRMEEYGSDEDDEDDSDNY